jgi:hypothetical protein
MEDFSETGHNRSRCPFCKADEKSFAIFFGEDGVTPFFKCHRAKCGAKGPVEEGARTRTAQYNVPVQAQNVRRRHWVMDKEKELVPLGFMSYMERRYHIEPRTLAANRVKMVEPNYLAMPAYDWEYKQIGWVYKGIAGAHLKVDEKRDPESAWYARAVLPEPGCLRHLIVVTEDLLSAYRYAQAGLNAVSLGGTYPHDGLLSAMIQAEVTHVVVHLDSDTLGTSALGSCLQVFGSHFETYQAGATKMEPDPKDMDPRQMLQRVDSIKQWWGCNS